MRDAAAGATTHRRRRSKCTGLTAGEPGGCSVSVTVADSVIRTRNARTNFLVMEFYCHTTQQWSANGRITAGSNLELLDASHCRSVVVGVAFLVVIVLRVSWEAGSVEHAASGGVQLNSYYRHQATVVSVHVQYSSFIVHQNCTCVNGVLMHNK